MYDGKETEMCFFRWPLRLLISRIPFYSLSIPSILFTASISAAQWQAKQCNNTKTEHRRLFWKIQFHPKTLLRMLTASEMHRSRTGGF